MILWWTAAWGADPTFEDASDRLDGVRIISVQVNGAGYSGVGMLDADSDGDLDLYFGNGPGQNNVLLANDGSADFTDLAVPAGAAVGTGSSGVLAADLDGDGAPDLVLPGDRSDLSTLQNNGNGTFVDITEASGLVGSWRNTSAHAADIDGDSDLDVFVSGGVVPSTNFINTLWRNNGDLTFTDVAPAAGVDSNVGACGVTFTHLDDDHWIDIIIANCNDIHFLPTPFEAYRNLGDGTFEDITVDSRIWASGYFMGLAFTDFDGDLDLDFFSTNVGTVGERRSGPHVLYRNNGDGTWSDVAADAGVAEQPFGWGAVAADFDNDGWEDLYYVGHAHAEDQVHSPGLLFMNRGDGTYAPPTIPTSLSGRWSSGLATGDLDNDGWMDLAVVVTESPYGDPGFPVLLMNRTDNGNHWISVRPHGAGGNPAAIGAWVYATPESGRPQLREIQAGSSYMSTNSPWPHFGLGSAEQVDLCIRWPDGTEERFGTFDVDQRLDLVQGEGASAVCAPPPDPVDGDGPEPCGCAAPVGPAGLGWIGVGLLIGARRRADPTQAIRPGADQRPPRTR